MSLSSEHVAILRVLAANDDLGHGVQDLLGTGLSEPRILHVLQELVALGLVLQFVCIADAGSDLMNQLEVA